MHEEVSKYMRDARKTTRVTRSDADWWQCSWPSVRDWASRKSTPLLVARLLLAIASLHVDENEDHDWVVGQFVRVVNGARAALKAQCGPMKHQWLRDGVTFVRAVPTRAKHNDGHVDKTHYDDSTAARTQRGLELTEQ